MKYKKDNIFLKCKHCDNIQEQQLYKDNHSICIKCGYHGSLTYNDRIKLILDKDSFVETHGEMSFYNPILFPEYDQKYNIAHKNTGLNEAVVTGRGTIFGIPTMIAVIDSQFMMGSMGAVVGEKIALLFEEADKEKYPVITFSASGGARMQEGVVSLMQMAKTSAAVARFGQLGGLYISVMTNPTTGGVFASFASLGDIILAEPGALIGFAGKRVIEQTIKRTIPDDFQTAEYLLEHGFIDGIIARDNLKERLYYILKMHNYEKGV